MTNWYKYIIILLFLMSIYIYTRPVYTWETTIHNIHLNNDIHLEDLVYSHADVCARIDWRL